MRFHRFISLIILLIFPVLMFSQLPGKLDLTGTWQFRQQGSQKIYNGQVPGSVQTDLFRNKLIPDPFYRDNEAKVQWVSDTGWVYERYFNLEPSFFSHRNIELVCEGLDTYANVYINDSLVLVADNMFKEWYPNVKYLLHIGYNKIRIEFISTPKENRKRYDSLPYKLPGDERTVCRKAAYQFGWDWGPTLVTMGIWKPIYLRYWDRVNLLGVRIIQRSYIDTVAHMSAVFTLNSTLADSAVFRLLYDGKVFFSDKEVLQKGINVIRADFDFVKPILWWPNGMGAAALYNLGWEVDFAGKKVAEGSKRIGIRTIELFQNKDSIGRSFFFKVNGKPAFIRGANFVPMDNFPARVSDSAYAALLSDADMANINMLRVWGGGIYERDKFYELCDEKGIMVWQDFMFANAMIPNSKDFVQSIREEAIQNIVRLRDHPCIALWCGNNEIDEGWRNWGWVKQYGYSKEDSTDIYKTYRTVFNEVIPNSIRRMDTLRPYITSSPKFGWGRPESMKEGDSHYWGVWWGKEPFSKYEEKIPRFMSEFGFQGFPDDYTINKFTLPEDRKLGSAVMKAHQKHPVGFETIDEYMKRDFRDPKNFEMYGYVSQVLQAEGVTKAIEAHRRAKPYCMGTMYWQFNDCWPGVSWSARDYYGKKKALWYRTKAVFTDQFVSAEVKNDTLRAFATTDDGFEQDIVFNMFLCDFGGNIIWNYDSVVKLDPTRSVMVAQAPVSYLLQGYDPKSVYIYMDVRNIFGVRCSKMLYLVPLKDLDLQKPTYQTKVKETDDGYAIELSTNTHSPYVRLSTEVEGEFLENYFDLQPQLTKVVLFKCKTKDPKFAEKLKVVSLYDSYN
jgi:beta-mannosidase